MASSQQQVYRITKFAGIDNLTQTTAEVPKPKRGQVLVRIHATSLNYRDLAIITGKYGLSSLPEGTIPLSDGAGEVVEVGEDVTEFKKGDRVCGTFNQAWVDGPIKAESLASCLGAENPGVLAQYRIFETTGIVKFPEFLSYEEAATLPCAALTAWNALMHGTQPIGPNQSVLILGTGGVAVFGIQFAAAAGARVIVASSSDEKLEKARSLGATDLINYKTNPNWDEKVREITGGVGVDHVLEIGGAGTLQRSLKAVRLGGQVHMIGILAAGPTEFDAAMAVLHRAVVLRGILVGSRGMFEEMNKAIEHNKIHPLIDRVFPFAEAKEAYRHLESQKHVGKVVIKIDQ